MLKPSPTGDEVPAEPDVSPCLSQSSLPQYAVPQTFKAKVTKMMMSTVVQLEGEHQRQLQQMEQQIQQRLLEMGYKEAVADLLASEGSEGLQETKSGGGLGSKSEAPMKQGVSTDGEHSRAVLYRDQSMANALTFRLLMAWQPEAFNKDIDQSSLTELQLVGGTSGEETWLNQTEKGKEVPVSASKCIMHPSSPFRMAWDLLAALALIYDLCVIPLSVFDVPEDRALFVMSVIIMMYWTLDLIGNFFVGYYKKNGTLELRWCRVAQKYCSRWFLPDLIIVSVDWLSYGRELFGSSSDGANVGGVARLARLGKAARFFRMVRVLRVVRIGKLQAIGQRFSDLFGLETSVIAFSLFKNLLLIVYVNHVIACGWFWIGKIHENEGWLAGRGKQGGEAWQDSYFLCLFWAIANFTPGSSGITPVTLEEHIYTCSVLFFALVVFTVLVSATTSLVTRLMAIQSARKHQLWLLRGFLHQHKIGHELRDRVLRYLQAAIGGHHTIIHKSEVQLLDILSQPLREEVQLNLHLATLRAHPFLTALASTSRPLMRKISTEALVEVQYSRGDITFSPGEEQTDMGFPLSGILEYHFVVQRRREGKGEEDSDVPSSSLLLQSGDFYCEAALWTKWYARGTMRADVDADVLSLRSSSFAAAVNKQPIFLNIVQDYARAFIEVLNLIASGQLSLPLHDLQASYLVEGEPIQNVLASLTLRRNLRTRSGG